MVGVPRILPSPHISCYDMRKRPKSLNFIFVICCVEYKISIYSLVRKETIDTGTYQENTDCAGMPLRNTRINNTKQVLIFKMYLVK